LQRGSNAAEDFSILSPRGKPVMIEPSWKEDRGVAIASPLDILLEVEPGACANQLFQLLHEGRR